MSTMLAKLKFVAATRPVGMSPKSPELARRDKMFAGLTEQINLVNAEIAGKPAYTVTRTKKNEGGVPETTEHRVRSWHWMEAAGTVLAEIKYGSTALKLGTDGKTAFRSASREDLVKAYKLVQQAVTAGDIDTELAQAAAKRQKKAKK